MIQVGRFQGFDHRAPTVRMIQPFLVEQGLAAGQHLPVGGAKAVRHGFGKQVQIGFPRDLPGGGPQRLGEGLVAAQINPVGVLVENQVGDRIDQAMQQRAFPGQSFLHFQQRPIVVAQALAHGGEVSGGVVEFPHRETGRGRAVVAGPDLLRHGVDAGQRRGQEFAHPPGAQIQRGEEHGVKQDQPGHQQPADSLEAPVQLDDVGVNGALGRHDQQRPARLRHGRPGGALALTLQDDLAGAAGLFAQACRQRAEFGAQKEVEVVRLEGIPQDQFRVVVVFQLRQAQVALAGWRQGQNGAVFPDQHAVPLPGNPERQNALDQGRNGDVQAHHGFQKIAVVDRRDAGGHPALAGRIDVHVGPHRFSVRVVPGVGLVVEVERGDIQAGGILLQHLEIGVDAVERIEGVQVDLADQGRVGLQVAHQGVQAGGAQHLVALPLADRDNAAVEHRRAAVFAPGVVNASLAVGVAVRFPGRDFAGLERRR